MKEKKHKSGYVLLKEKYAALEAKNAELQKEKKILVQTAQDNYCRVEKERDELKMKVAYLANGDAAYYRERDAYQRHLTEEYEPLLNEHREDKKRIAFLLDHCPFWVRLAYKKKFNNK